MRSQAQNVELASLEGVSSPVLVTVPIPANFRKMDLTDRIEYIAQELKTLESKYPAERQTLKRHTSLVRIGEGKLTYSVEYLPIPDDDY